MKKNKTVVLQKTSKFITPFLYFGAIFVFYFSFSPLLVFAAPPFSPYAPGETLEPACAPTSTNCTVVSPATAGDNLNITSLNGLTTPLSALQGGTGLSSFVAGDLLFAASTSTFSSLAIGANNSVLVSSGGNPAWSSGLNLENLSVSGTSTLLNLITNTSTVVGSQFVGDQLSVLGASTLEGSLAVVGAITGSSSLNILGDTTLGGTISLASISAPTSTANKLYNQSGSLVWAGSELLTNTTLGNYGVTALSSDNNIISVSSPTGSVVIGFNVSSTLSTSSGQLGLNLASSNIWEALQTFNSGITANTLAVSGTSTIADLTVTTSTVSGSQTIGGQLSVAGAVSFADTLDVGNGVVIVSSSAPTSTTDKIYNQSGLLMWTGNELLTNASLGNYGVTSFNAGNGLFSTASTGTVGLSLNTDSSLSTSTGQLGLNLGNANTWDALQTFNSGLVANALTVSGSSTIANLTVSTSTISGSQTIGGQLSVTGAANFGNTLAITGTTTFSDGSVWNTTGLGLGTSTIQEKLAVDGRVVLGSVTDPGTTNSKLYNVAGTLKWAGVPVLTSANLANFGVSSISVGTGLSRTPVSGLGPVTISLDPNSTLSVGSGQLGLNLASANTWTGAQTFSVTSTLATTTIQKLTVTGATTFSSSLTAIGALSGSSTLAISGNTTLGGTLTLSGTTTFPGTSVWGGSGVGIGTTTLNNEALSVNGRIFLVATSSPAATTDKLYNQSGSLYWAGNELLTSLSLSSYGVTALSAGNGVNISAPTGTVVVGLNVSSTLSTSTGQLGLNLGNANIWSALQTFNSGAVINSTTISGTLTLPGASTWSSNGVGIGTTTLNSEVLAVSGRVSLASVAAPTSTANKLYNQSGSLYWAGNELLTSLSLGSYGVTALSTGNGLSATAPTGTVILSLNTNSSLSTSTGQLGLNLTNANTWSALQTFSSGAVISSATISGLSSFGNTLTLPGSGTWSSGGVGIGTTTLNSEILSVGGRVSLASVSAPTSTANKLYNQSGSLMWAGNELLTSLSLSSYGVTALSAGNGVNISAPTGTVVVGLNVSSTLSTSTGQLGLNLSNANIWSAAQTFNSGATIGALTAGSVTATGTASFASSVGVTGAITVTGTARFNGATTFAVTTTLPGTGVWTTGGLVGINTSSPTESLTLNGRLHLLPTSAPSTLSERLYNASGVLTWSGNTILTSGILSSYAVTNISTGNGLSASAPFGPTTLSLDVNSSLTTASQLGLNLANANTWSALQTFSSGISANTLTVFGTSTIADLIVTTSTVSGSQTIGGQLSVTGAVNLANVLTVNGVGIGTTTLNSEALSVSGRIFLASGSAPTSTTDKLYNQSGSLYFSGSQLVTAASLGSYGVSSIAVGNGLIASTPAGAVTFSLNTDASLTTSSGQLTLNVGNANTWSALQTFSSGISANTLTVSGTSTIGDLTVTTSTVSGSQTIGGQLSATGAVSFASTLAITGTTTLPGTSIWTTSGVGIGTTTLNSEVLSVNGRIFLASGSAPTSTTDKLYNQSGSLYFAGNQLVTTASIGGFGVTSLSVGNGLTASASTGTVALSINTNATLSTSTGQLTINLANANTWSAIQNFSAGIGIGTSTPTGGLEIWQVGTSPQLTLSAASSTTSIDPIIAFRTGATPSTQFIMGVDYSDSNKFKISSSSVLGTKDIFTISSSGNVGIGTSSPATKLEVNGVINTTNAGGNATGDINAGSAGVYSWNGASRYVRFNTNGSINDLQSIGAALVINYGNAQNVIIGGTQVAAPNKLNVMGSLGVGASYGAIAAPTNGAIFEGNVGIGISSPSNPLHVLGSGSTSQAEFKSSDSYARIQLNGATGSGGDVIFKSNGISKFGIYNPSGGSNLGFYPSDGATAAMMITGNSTVGIGISSPSTTLDIFGGLTVRGLSTSTGFLFQERAGQEGKQANLIANNTASAYAVLNIYRKSASLASKAQAQLSLWNVDISSEASTQPTANFRIENDSANTLEIFTTSGNVVGAGGPIILQANSNSVANGNALKQLTLTTDNKIGINTTTPESVLDVVGGDIVIRTVSTSKGFTFMERPGLGGVQAALVGRDTASTYTALNVYRKGATFASKASAQFALFNVDPAVEAGTNPEAALLLDRDAANTLLIFTTSFNNAGLGGPILLQANNLGTLNQLALQTNNNIGIGVTTSASALELYRSASSSIFTLTVATTTTSYDPAIAFRTGSSTALVTQFTMGVDYSDSNKFKISSSSVLGTSDIFTISAGNVGINSSTPEYTLDVAGDFRATGSSIYLPGLSAGGGTDTLQITAAGQVVRLTSSRRYKHDITNFEVDLAKIVNLQPVRFKWNKDTATPDMADMGLIAEDTEPVLPELVTRDTDGTIRGVDYRKLSVLLLSAMQQQQQQIVSLQQTVSSSLLTPTAPVAVWPGTVVSLVVQNQAEFQGTIVVKRHLTVGDDVAGWAEIRPGDSRVSVRFEEPYDAAPAVTISTIRLTLARFAVDNVTKNGFDIVIDTPVVATTSFAWHALGVERGVIFVSDGTTTTVHDDTALTEISTGSNGGIFIPTSTNQNVTVDVTIASTTTSTENVPPPNEVSVGSTSDVPVVAIPVVENVPDPSPPIVSVEPEPVAESIPIITVSPPPEESPPPVQP